MSAASSGPWTASDATLDDLVAGRLPDDNGRYGAFGGRFVPETLVQALFRLEDGPVRHFATRLSGKLSTTNSAIGWAARPP